jgi:carboxypeptidase C (cathepsin A)
LKVPFFAPSFKSSLIPCSIDFLKNFEVTFGIQNFKIYVTGESYAGRYVPYIASVMLDRHDKTHYNISGISHREAARSIANLTLRGFDV